MSHSMYQLTTYDGTPTGTAQLFGLVHDWDEALSDETLEIRARVQSGDYFSTLATELDKLAQSLGQTAEAAVLESYVSELLYIDKNYQIKRT